MTIRDGWKGTRPGGSGAPMKAGMQYLGKGCEPENDAAESPKVDRAGKEVTPCIPTLNH